MAQLHPQSLLRADEPHWIKVKILPIWPAFESRQSLRPAVVLRRGLQRRQQEKSRLSSQADRPRIGRQFVQQLKPLRCQRASKEGHAGHVAARMVDRLNEAKLDRIIALLAPSAEEFVP
jgi:hypothetical protein